MMAHTPGPWEAYTECPGECCWLVRQCATEDSDGEGVTWPETSLANARLIAAAPDLLAALEVSRGQWIHSVNASQCLAAIKKATGEG